MANSWQKIVFRRNIDVKTFASATKNSTRKSQKTFRISFKIVAVAVAMQKKEECSNYGNFR